MYRNKPVSQHQFSMVPRADIPRSSFRMTKTLKTTFDASALVPVFLEEVLPGDKFNVSMTAFARMGTPIVPFMDNMHLDCFWFFCPNRLVWDNWAKFMGEQKDPGDSISFTIPQVVSPIGGWIRASLADYFGIPTAGQINVADVISTSALPFRMYNLIYNEWFRDENLQDSVFVSTDDGDTSLSDCNLLTRGKRHDYFTSCLPFAQKGTAVSIGVGGLAPVQTQTLDNQSGVNEALHMRLASGAGFPAADTGLAVGSANGTVATNGLASGLTGGLYPANLVANLSAITAGTVNTLRQSFQIQKLLERDARGGTRYTEIVRSHFGVMSPDARLQRPEYLGGGSCLISVNPVAQTSATTASGSDTPAGSLSAVGTALLRSGFTQAFTEHGYVMCLVCARADITYQQGLRRHWKRQTRYDFYFPVFANLGEQAVLNREIYITGDNQPFDDDVFGYQERWAEYRYTPSEISGNFRSYAPASLDYWHFAEEFGSVPGLNSGFIVDNTSIVLPRVFALGSLEQYQQFICDIYFDNRAARPLPMYSVPGLVDHF